MLYTSVCLTFDAVCVCCRCESECECECGTPISTIQNSSEYDGGDPGRFNLVALISFPQNRFC